MNELIIKFMIMTVILISVPYNICSIMQCLQAVLLSFSINIPITYLICIHLLRAPYNYDVRICTKFPQFSVFLKFYQYLWSEFSKNTDKSVYLEAL